jgi:hypothetical protein
MVARIISVIKPDGVSFIREPLKKANSYHSTITLGNRMGLMLSCYKTFIICLFALALIVSPLSALSANVEEIEQIRDTNPPDPGAMIVDLIAVRPLGLVATLAGSAVFIVSIPFSALGGNTEVAWERLVAEPAAFTFKRPLGEFDN